MEGSQKAVKNKEKNCELSNHNQGNKITCKILTVVKKAKEIDKRKCERIHSLDYYPHGRDSGVREGSSKE